FIEFVSPPIAIGDEPISSFVQHETEMGTVKMLTPSDAVKDRLASFYHWGDRQGLEQAINICTEAEGVNLEDIARWSTREGFPERYNDFLALLKRKSG
ncbi:MAG: hypothetical protein KDK78_03410, partial [Chlamydiia bacterium]|nr:hypothetical protein [Chlamydiia bacterium]